MLNSDNACTLWDSDIHSLCGLHNQLTARLSTNLVQEGCVSGSHVAMQTAEQQNSILRHATQTALRTRMLCNYTLDP